MKHTDETKAKLSAMQKGENNSFYGKRHTPETKAKLGQMLRQYDSKRQIKPAERSIDIPIGTALAYLAGIIDGEGSIRFRGDRPFVAIYNTSKPLMDWIDSTVAPKTHLSERRGRTTGYTWCVQGARDVYALCVAILPYLIVKREDALAAIDKLEEKYGRNNCY